MPLTTYQGTTEMTTVIPTELLATFIDEYEYPQHVWQMVSHLSAGLGNVPKNFSRWDALTVPAGGIGIAETVDAPDGNVALSESTITPSMTRWRMPISDEAITEASLGVPAGALSAGLDAMSELKEIDVLGVSTSATLSVLSNLTTFDTAAFRTMLQTYRALNLPAPRGNALVLHDDTLAALEGDIDASSSNYLLKSSDTLSRALGPAFMGEYRGFMVFRSPHVAVDGAGHSNFAQPIGDGIGVVVNELPSVVRTRGDEAENRASTFYHFRLWMGQGVKNPRRLLEVLSA